jgi:hypothetical protein
VSAPRIDVMTIHQFLGVITFYAKRALEGVGNAGDVGVLQLSRINPNDDKTVVPSRFGIDDVAEMARVAIDDAANGHNVYLEARTVRADLRGNRRGGLEDTAWVFGLVVDSDADKGKGGNVSIQPTVTAGTSPGNFHFWYLFTRAILAGEAKLIGDVMRANSGADQDTGVVTQCYRVAGTPNYPSAAKRARGRVNVEATTMVLTDGRLWEPKELLAAFSALSPQPSPPPQPPQQQDANETTLPDDLAEIVRNGAPQGADRSALFHSVVAQLRKRNWDIDAIVALFEKYPTGVAAKYYPKRVRKEVERSYAKILKSTAAPGAVASGTSGTASGAAPGATPGAAPGAAPATAPTPHILPTIRLVEGQLPRIVKDIERALLAAGAPVFSRAGSLVEPVSEMAMASGGRRTMTAKLRPLDTDALIELVAEAALFQRFNRKRNTWIDADPPLQMLRTVLAREGRWIFPRVSGVITTPTLRFDGSLLATSGYDCASELYLMPGMQVPAVPDNPTREQAQASLKILVDVFSEFSFKNLKLDRSVALAGLLTTVVRGSIPTSPMILVRADTPGVGKSYLVDLIAMAATGRLCPVITSSKNIEETEKRIGAVLLSGASIMSVDNCVHDLEGQLLCQLTERPVVKVRILGRSEMPECECHTTVFATGNNIGFCGDMVRRGLVCNLEALDERPELRAFKRDAHEVIAAGRGVYIAAALTIVRAYLTARAPQVARLDRRTSSGVERYPLCRLWPIRQLFRLVEDGAQPAGLAG